MAGRSSRVKGYRGEKEVEKILQGAGFTAMRVPLSGSVAGFISGDVIVEIKNKKLRCEVKRRKSGFKTLYQWLTNKDILFVREDKEEWLVALKLSDFISLIAEGSDNASLDCRENKPKTFIQI